MLGCHIFVQLHKYTHDNRHKQARETQKKVLTKVDKRIDLFLFEKFSHLLGNIILERKVLNVLSVVFNWELCAICDKGTANAVEREFSLQNKQETPVLNTFPSPKLYPEKYIISKPYI